MLRFEQIELSESSLHAMLQRMFKSETKQLCVQARLAAT